MSKIHQDLLNQGISCSGFITEEIRINGRRTGFDVVTLTGKRGQLARVSDSDAGMPSTKQRDIKVGQYSVNLISFEQTALITLKLPPLTSETSTQVYLIDEIGKMELYSQSFIQAVRKLMSQPNVTLVATIPVPKGRPIPFVEELRGGENSLVFEVNRQNRDVIHTDILQAVKTSLSSE
ncbi:cancer-related nucleoside-triphosphatase-like [Elysia marginata]|uniref:Cancer-related nucleoside-triphosphatase-like n=1 Tax=Elysia marginata TaxID=1093978 RepID=A0AAV4IPT3_9GAST|nr:cancer-related nucleoside-triphosphatase-like [Elysia marginata]